MRKHLQTLLLSFSLLLTTNVSAKGALLDLFVPTKMKPGSKVVADVYQLEEGVISLEIVKALKD